jgi:hypothetical protein
MSESGEQKILMLSSSRNRFATSELVFCHLKEGLWSLLFVKNAVTVNSYLDMITLRLLPQGEEHSNDFVFHQNGVAPHFDKAVQNHLNAQLP